MKRFLLATVAIVAAFTLYAQDRTTVAPNGTRMTAHTVQLLTGMPAACVSLPAKGSAAVIVLPRDELDRLAGPHTAVEEAGLKRIDLLAESRAREFMKTLGTGHDRYGCVAVSEKVSLETSYLIGWLLERGHALVITNGQRLPEPVVVVRHVDAKIVGWEEFLLADGRAIWSYGTWVS